MQVSLVIHLSDVLYDFSSMKRHVCIEFVTLMRKRTWLCSARKRSFSFITTNPSGQPCKLVQISNFTANPHNGLFQRQWGKIIFHVQCDSEVMRLEYHARHNTIPPFHLGVAARCATQKQRHQSCARKPSRRRPLN